MLKRALIAVVLALLASQAMAQGGPGGPGPVPDPWTINGLVIFYNKGSVNSGSSSLGNTGIGTFNAQNGYYINGVLVDTITSVTSPLTFSGAMLSCPTCLTTTGSFANPTAKVGLSAVNGSDTTAMRSDASPPLDQTISPIWTGTHTFTNSLLRLLGSSTGYTTFTSANGGASNFTLTFPAVTDTLAVLGTAQTWTALQKYTNGDLGLLGSSTGYTLLESGLSGAGNNTLTLPTTSSDTLAALGTAQTWSALQQFNDGDFALKGSASGTLVQHAAAAAGSSVLTWPAGTTDFTATGSAHYVVRQSSAGAALTVGQLACSDLSDSVSGCSGTASSITVGNPVIGGTNSYLLGISSGGNLASQQFATLAQGGLGGDQSAAAANTVPVFPGSGGAAVPTTLASIFASPSPIGGTTPAAGAFNGLTATGSFTATGLVTNGDLATMATNTVKGNKTSGSASPTDLAVGSCSTAASALIWTTNTGFGCNTSINAATLGGATFAAPGAIGGGTAAAGTFTALTGTSGSITGLTGLAIRDTSAAFDVTLAATSSTTLTAGRTLTLDLKNVAHTLAFGSTANTITFPNLTSYTVITNGDTGSVTNTMLAGSIAASKLIGTDIATVGTLTAGATGAGFTVALGSSTITGQLALTNGGAGGSLTASNGGIVYSDASRLQILAGTASANLCLLSGSNTAPTWGACAGSAAVASVGNAAADSSLTIAGTGSGPWTGAITAKLNLANAQTWTAAQTFTDGDFLLKGSSSGAMTLKAPAAASTYVMTFPAATDTVAVLGLADQTLSGGANVTSSNQGTKSSGTYTVDCGASPLQYITNGGAFTLAAPSNDGSCMIYSLNNGSAGAITFSGFTVGPSTGDALDTTNTHKFTITIWCINSVASYLVKALQ